MEVKAATLRAEAGVHTASSSQLVIERERVRRFCVYKEAPGFRDFAQALVQQPARMHAGTGPCYPLYCPHFSLA
jgi:hypothetical protein